MPLKPGAFPAVALLLLASVAYATDLSGTISTAVSLPAGAHRMVGGLTIAASATLTLDPGATLTVTGNYGMSVYGGLVANGTPSQTCYIGASSSGSWQGITILTGGSVLATSTTFSGARTNITDNGGSLNLSACRLQSASLDGLAAYSSSVVQLSSCDFASCTRRGLYLETASVTGSVGACTFTAIGEYPVLAKAALVRLLAGPLTFTSVTYPVIGVSCSADQDITGAHTWPWLGYDYDLRAGTSFELNIAPGASLTLNPGVRVRGGSIHVEGSLITGGVGAPVYLYGPSGESGNPGDWPGLDTAGGVLSLTNTVIRDAENGILADGGSVSLSSCSLLRTHSLALETVHSVTLTATGCTVNGCGRSGLFLSAATTGNVASTSIAACTEWPVYVFANAVAVLGSGLTFSGNGLATIGVVCNLDPDVTVSQTWRRQDLPYDLAADPAALLAAIAPGVTLTLAPGVRLLTGGLDVRGALNALGTGADPIYLTSAKPSPVPGDCVGINFAPGSAGTLDHVVVEYAQTGLTIGSSSPSVLRTRLAHCSQDGLAVSGAGAAPIVYWSTCTANARYGIYIGPSAQPDLGDLSNGSSADDGMNVLTANLGAYDLYNASASNLQAQNNWWGTNQTDAIAARIYDHTENAQYGVVNFTPIHGAPPNTPPELAWLGTGSYVGTGLAPQLGTPSTNFVFKVLYRDADGNPPSYVRVHLRSGGSEISNSPFTMTLEGSSPNYFTGATFSYQRALPVGRDYTYFFDAADPWASATGAPTSAQAGPVVTHPPSLAWTGQTGYQSGGVQPTTGFADDTLFDFRVTYSDQDGDAPTGVFLHVFLGGADVPGSPFAMTRVSGTYAGGAIYQRATTLAQASDTGYTYSFAASDGIYAATGAPTSPTSGPVVKWRPKLSFPAETGYELTGVQPQAGLFTGPFHFAVIYSHQRGLPPSSVVVHVARGGVEVTGSPFLCAALDSNPIASGRKYGADLTLAPSKDYTHWFSATDGTFTAYGPATLSVSGPISDQAPVLSFPTSGPGAGTGIAPPSGGLGATQFTWRVVYSDADTDPPRFVTLRLFRDGAEIPGSPFVLAPEIGGNYHDGKTYTLQKRLTQSGSWQYSFLASDSYLESVGPASSLQSGPVLSGAFELAPLTDTVACNGLYPSVGEAQSTPFTFAVVYRSPSGTAPSWAHVVLTADGHPDTARTFTLTPLDNHPITDGRAYTTTTTLDHGNYAYYFEATDGTTTARTDDFTGPLINTRPHLAWVGDPGYTNGGFSPASGISGQTLFSFRVRYTDADGDAPVKFRLVIYLRTDLLNPLNYAMTPETTGDPRNGIVYRVSTTLTYSSQGLRYRFDLDDGYAPADGAPSLVAPGPTVTTAPLSAPMIYAAHVFAGPTLATVECSATRTDLSADGVVLNLAGREIAAVAGTMDLASKRLRFAWPYMSRHGVRVPPGPYLFVIRAHAATGESYQRILRLDAPRR
jgi:hypothetical protein